MSKIAHGFGKFFIGTATLLLLGALIVFGLGTYLLYWPLSRATPRYAKMRAIANVLADLQALWQLAANDAPREHVVTAENGDPNRP